jgi:hypothetical protein
MTTRLIYTLIFLSLISCQSKVDYEPMGAYRYDITNDSVFKLSVFSANSYGYSIGDLNYNGCGIRILDTDTLSINGDYIVAMKPIASVSVVDDGVDYVQKKALDVILKNVAITDSIYIYALHPKGAYRLMLP